MLKKDKKINMIYDATLLANGVTMNSNRTGIYMVVYYLLKALSKREDTDITLYCENTAINDLLIMLKKDFSYKNFKVISDVPVNYITINYGKLKNIRNSLKEEKRYIAKNILQLFLIIYSLVYKLTILFHKSNIDCKNYDVYFSPAYVKAKMFSKKKNIKFYTLLHDTIPLLLTNYHEEALMEGAWFRVLLDSLNSEDYYIANSDQTRKDFLKFYPIIDSTKIKTVMLACDEKFKPFDYASIEKTKEKYNIQNKKYIFSLCTLEPRKNLIRAVKSFIEFIRKNNIDDLYFVLGGGHWDKFIGVLESEISDLGLYKDKIIKIGYVEDEDLAPLYSGAEWFVYTSQYEGFGLPPLEAMSCGCPVITSNNSSLPEVVGDAGIMIDWDSDEQHIKAYEQYYYNKDLTEENIQKGLERAKLFSWTKTVNTIVEIMKKDLGYEKSSSVCELQSSELCKASV